MSRYTATRVLMFADEFWFIEAPGVDGGILLEPNLCGSRGEMTVASAATMGYASIVCGIVWR